MYLPPFTHFNLEYQPESLVFGIKCAMLSTMKLSGVAGHRRGGTTVGTSGSCGWIIYFVSDRHPDNPLRRRRALFLPRSADQMEAL